MSDQKVSLNRLDAVTKSLLILLNDKGIRYSSTSLSYGNYSVSGIHLLVVIWHFSKDSPSSLRHGLASCVHVLRSWTLYTKSKTSQYLRGKKPPPHWPESSKMFSNYNTKWLSSLAWQWFIVYCVTGQRADQYCLFSMYMQLGDHYGSQCTRNICRQLPNSKPFK